MADEIETIVQTVLKAKIIESLTEQPDTILSLIKAALSQKVSEDGKVSRYSHENKYELLDSLVGIHLRRAASKAVEDYLKTEEVAAIIKQGVRDAFAAKNIEESVTNALVGAAAQDWAVRVSFEKRD